MPLSGVKLLVPVIPPTFYAAGVNYREHVTEMVLWMGTDGATENMKDGDVVEVEVPGNASPSAGPCPGAARSPRRLPPAARRQAPRRSHEQRPPP